MKKLCCAAAIAVVLSGCVSAPTKSLEPGSAMQGKQVAVSQYAKPDFAAMTAGKAVFSVFGAVAMINAGNELVRTENIDDPAVEIGAQLASDMAAKHSATLLPATHHVATDDKPASLIKAYSGADMILDVKTINWSFGYFPTEWARYRVIYSARVRLIDGKTGALVAQHMCKIVPSDATNAPTLEALKADHAALLKASLHKAAETCIADVEQHALRV